MKRNQRSKQPLSSSKCHIRKHSGVTLIELLIVIAIVGILASVAYPSLQSYLLRTNRGDAQAELLKAQLKQTAWHILNPIYSNDKAELGLVDNERFTFAVTSASSTTYTIKAEAIGQQVNDSSCTLLTINQESVLTPDDCW